MSSPGLPFPANVWVVVLENINGCVPACMACNAMNQDKDLMDLLADDEFLAFFVTQISVYILYAVSRERWMTLACSFTSV